MKKAGRVKRPTFKRVARPSVPNVGTQSADEALLLAPAHDDADGEAEAVLRVRAIFGEDVLWGQPKS